jgi:TatA/E family protein of Tat protein translocase
MGIGIFEILIIVLIILVLFGGYKRLPALGRSAGSGVRKGGEKAKQIAGQVQDKAGSVDSRKIGESVGKGLREARDVRDTVKGIATDEPARTPAEPAAKPVAEPAEKPPAERPTES